MQRVSYIAFFFALLFAPLVHAQSEKRTLRRAESFFGLHFDLHAQKHFDRGGETLTEAMIDSLLVRVRPDYVQVDSKGHPGIASYPTRVGTPMAGFVRDPLALWRKVTQKHGVALYVHYSGVQDHQAVAEHPEWARIDVKGDRDRQNTSVFRGYVDNLLIPQLKELRSDWQVDGVWVDGECWSLHPDYSPEALAAFRKETGKTSVPRKSGDPYWKDFLEFNRSAFRRYLAYYVETLHTFDPDFQIASNWAYSSMMPEPVDVNVDFLSGDLPPNNSVNMAAFEARCLAPQGKPWDLMGWSFGLSWSDPERPTATKSAVQLQQEAAEVLAMGGGYQAYFRQNADLSIQPWTIGRMAQLAAFCRARQAISQGAVPVPQIALLYSTVGWKHSTDALYQARSEDLDALKGITTALLDGQHTFEILMEHHLRGKMPDYPLIIVPEWEHLEPAFRDELLDYVQKGGNLLLIGAETTTLFLDELGVVAEGRIIREGRNWLAYEGEMAGLNARYLPVQPADETQTLGTLHAEQDLRFPGPIAATVRHFGQGRIGGIYTDLGENYIHRSAPLQRDFLTAVIRTLFPEPLVEVVGSKKVHVTANLVGGKLVINLINTNGPHADPNIFVYDEITTLGPLSVLIRTHYPPRKVLLEPGSTPLPYFYANGNVTVTLPELEIHSAVVIE